MPTSKNTARKYAAGGGSDNSCGVEPLRAVIYARYSSSGQREESIEGQLRDCYEFAKKHGIIVIGEYIDKAMTGRVDRRPDFQRMMKDSEKGRFNCVLLWKMDRFARNRYDSAMYKYKLKKNGIRIFYAKETIPDGPEGIILESVMEGYAEYYSENLAQNVKRGNYDSALELKTLGKTCLGLKTGPDGRYMIDQAEAVIVRRIFEEYAAGERAKDIYERLNSEGYRTSRGGKFNKNSLRRILSNKKYIGVYEYEDIYVENGIPAIITDRDLFERVQKMLKINHDAPARGKAQNFLLTTKLFCGLCGSPMIGDGGTSHTGKAYAYYSCTKRKRGRSCKKESVPKDWIEDLVVGELVKIVHNDELIEQIADRVMEYQKREKDQSGLHALEIRQKENEKAISNMLAAIEAGIITPSTKTRLMELEADRADIEKGIAHELLAEPEFERDQIIYFLERFRSGDINDEAYRIMLVDTFLNSVYLYDDDHLVLVMNYSGENCKVDLKLVEGAVSGDGCKGSAFAPSSAGGKTQRQERLWVSFFIILCKGGFDMKMSEAEKKQLYDKLFDVIWEDVHCIIEIDHHEGQYFVLEQDDFFENIIKEKGTLRDLYRILFLKNGKQEEIAEGGYDRFIDESIFQKAAYQSGIRFHVNEEERGFHFRLLKTSQDKSIILFFSEDSLELSNMLEMEKIDTLQESYLFSMIVDLAKDSCVNPNTTEVSASRQDYMDIKYSDWRVMISNMFKEEDKVLFFRATSPENVINTLEMRNSFHIDLQMMNIQGEFVWCRLNFVRMKNFSRENPRFVYTVSDISEDMLQLLRQEGLVKVIEEQNERLQEADKNKTKFLSNMSHEIRTPINAIMGMNEVILRDCKDEKIQGYARDVKAASQYLLSLVNDILDYSKIEAGKMEIVPVEYDMADLINKVCNMIRPRILEKSIEFELKVGADVPSRLFGDEIRIAQILINLLTNAAKYTDQGKVSFLIERGEDTEGQAAIKFTVKDTGIGIKQEDMDTLFAEFGRLDLLRNRNMEGTGLGMSIVEGLLMEMNSRLEVESVYGKGSAFSFTLLQKVVDELPVKMSDANKETAILEMNIMNAQDKKVLVVDDTAVNLRLFKALMAPYKVEVHCAKGGKEALDMIKGNTYHVVFLDHMMPEMDGVETLAQLRQINDYYKSVPVIALTGNYSPTAREEYISLGFTDYLEKPVAPKVLDELMHKYIE